MRRSQTMSHCVTFLLLPRNHCLWLLGLQPFFSTRIHTFSIISKKSASVSHRMVTTRHSLPQSAVSVVYSLVCTMQPSVPLAVRSMRQCLIMFATYLPMRDAVMCICAFSLF